MRSFAQSGDVLDLDPGASVATGVGHLFGASLFGKASESVFRSICYVLVAAAVIIGLPALDGVLRGR